MPDRPRFAALLPAALISLLLTAPVTVTAHADSALDNWLDGICEHGEGCMHGKLLRDALSRGLEGLGFDQAWDEESGADRRHFPPDRIVHHEHMLIEMLFGDLNDRTFTARQTLRVRPVAGPVTALGLDAIDLDIHSVRLANGSDVEHHADGKRLTLRFDPPLAGGQSHELVFEYTCSEPYNGLFFTPSSLDAPGYGPEVHTQGQPESNRHWFIAHDFPNEMMTTELVVDVPAGYQVSSNGRLVSNVTVGDREVWHWLQDKPHVSYLVTLIIGRFDIVTLEHDRVPMKVWVPEGLGHQVEGTYGQTGAMIDLFERLFGLEYPWARYDQLVVKNFGSGGMENTAATTMYPTAIFDEIALEDGDLDSLIAHELAHQWTGNLLTCRSWEHIWLNEGWATISSALWFEERDGEDGYLDSIRRSFGVARRDLTTNDLPMVSPIYGEPFETFRRAANPYPKGASIIHMLRRELGEEIFWRAVRLYIARHAHQTVETSDFRYALEEVSGRGLEWFFDQWCYRPGSPELDVNVHYDAFERELTVRVHQLQHMDARTPAFRFDLPIYVETANGPTTFTMEVRDRTAILRRVLDGPPSIVAIDPWLHVLSQTREQKSDALWQQQLERGPTIAARHAAAEALGRRAQQSNIDRLLAIALDDNERYTLRQTAIDAIASAPDSGATILRLVEGGALTHPRVRLTAVRALRGADPLTAMPLLAHHAGSDRSYAVRAAAIRELARHLADHADVAEATAYRDLIIDLADFESQHDQVRIAALDALATIDEPRGLGIAARLSAYGHMDRMRPTAIDTVRALAEHDHERAVGTLLPLLHDPERRAMRAAGAALAALGDERARTPIESLARAHRDPAVRRLAERWLAQLNESGG